MMLEKKELGYRNVAYIFALFLIIRIFIRYNNPIIDLFYEIAKIGTMTFMYLALRKRILLIGLGFIAVAFNIKLLVNPLIQIQTPLFFSPMVHKFTVSIFIIGVVCLISGMINKSEDSFFTKRVQLDNKLTIGLLILFTVLVQLILRIIW